KLIGKDVTAFINVTIEHPKYNDGFTKAVTSNGAVVECNYIAGDFDFLLKVETDNTKSLELMINDIKCIPGVEKTKSIIVLSMLKNVHSAEV
ncbi:MAG: Lrp/AsnC ligand binding domain-containing protein, partial [Oscillospiraceae bacterium]